ncbi:MAG: PASTA domain-containing protein [Reichenbachiella sp.]
MSEEKVTTPTTNKDLLKHFAAATVMIIVVVYGVFNYYFPMITNHGESLTVPNLEGVMLDDLDDFLEDRDLRYQVEPDSGYSAKHPALAVLKQFPLPNSKVKENRKIYVTLNAKNPPVVKMANLKGRSLKNAQLELRSLGLALGEIRYEPDYALNTILNQYHKGKIIQSGETIPKGSKVDFEVGDGLGNQTFQMLELKNLDLEEAIFVLRGNGLKVGEIFYKSEGLYTTEKRNSEGEFETKTINVEPGKVYKQNPESSKTARIGQSIDLWMVEIDSSQIVAPTLDLEVQ